MENRIPKKSRQSGGKEEFVTGYYWVSAGIPHRDFYAPLGNDDGKVRRKVKSGDIYLSITVKVVKIEQYHQGRCCRENKLKTGTKVRIDM